MEVDGNVIGEISRGYCALLAVEVGDAHADVVWLARKIANLRLFPDEEGRTNLDLAAVDGAILLVSQFTLAGECSKGNRPSFVRAAAPDLAEELYEAFAEELRQTHGLQVQTGRFAASMQVHIVNDGPFTVLLETPRSNVP